MLAAVSLGNIGLIVPISPSVFIYIGELIVRDAIGVLRHPEKGEK